jgi:hypothetical protein
LPTLEQKPNKTGHWTAAYPLASLQGSIRFKEPVNDMGSRRQAAQVPGAAGAAGDDSCSSGLLPSDTSPVSGKFFIKIADRTALAAADGPGSWRFISLTTRPVPRMSPQ